MTATGRHTPGSWDEPVSRRWPAWVVSLSCLALAALASPRLASRWVSLQWRIGDLAVYLSAFRLVALLAALCALLARSRLNHSRLLALRSPRRAAFALVAAVLGTGLALVVGELVLRVADLPYRVSWQPAENAIGRFDDELGWSYRPGVSTVQTIGSPPRSVAVHIGSLGNRVSAPDAVPREDVPTLLLVGGSYTMGHGVEYEQSFAGRIAADPSVSLQVVNLGVQGYGSDQALLMLRRHVDRFDTRCVVYTFHPSHVQRNEVTDRRVLWPDGRFLGTKPRFEMTREGLLQLRDSPVLYGDRRRPHLLDLAELAWWRVGPLPSAALTSALAREMDVLASERDAVFLVVLWTRAHDAPPDAIPRALFPWLDPGRAIDLGAGAPPGWDQWIIPGDGHPDERAHARVGTLLSRKIKALDLVAQEAPGTTLSSSRR